MHTMSNDFINRPPVPEVVKRILRVEAGYGCCVCGHPIFQYHHIIPYNIDPHFRPEDMMILCPNHHDEVKVMSEGDQRAFKEKPFNFTRNLVNGNLHVKQDNCDLKLGNSTFSSGPGTIIKIDNEHLLSVRQTSHGTLLLNVKLYDAKNELVAEIVDNEWVARTNVIWDLEYSYNLLIIRSALYKISLKINASVFPIEILGKLWFNNQLITLQKSKMKIGNAQIIGNFKIVGGIIEIDSKKGGFRLVGNPYNRYIEPNLHIGRNDPCWCGSGLKYKRCHLDKIV